MKTHSFLKLALMGVLATSGVGHAHQKCAIPTLHPEIDVCFVLDTTGSMGGLIAGAKRKIWKIANDIAKSQPKELRFGLVGYRDRGDTYITKRSKLTTDLDLINTELTKFTAGGGGDGPESVNQALYEAIENMSWKTEPGVKRIIFLVGDAPPHMDYDNDVRYPALCKLASKKGIYINTLLCGSDQKTKSIWQEIAQSSNGHFAAVPQDSGTRVIETPHDKEISRISIELNGTVVGYGDVEVRREVEGKKVAADSASVESQAWRNAYAAKNYKGKVLSGRGDLVEEWNSGNVKLDKLAKEELPQELRKLNQNELKSHLGENLKKRQELQKELKNWVSKREAYLKTAKPKAVKDSFDDQVSEILGKQLKTK